MNKYAELEYQLQGLKNAIEKMEYGIKIDDVRHISAEMRYFKEKAEKVSFEAQEIIDQKESSIQKEEDNQMEYRAIVKDSSSGSRVVERAASIWLNNEEEAKKCGDMGVDLYKGTHYEIESREKSDSNLFPNN